LAKVTHISAVSSVVDGDVGFQKIGELISTADMVKGFGCRQAYESPSCRNPPATIDDYGDFGFG
jgi:hypothetical protein